MAKHVLSIYVGHTLTKVSEIDYKVKNPKVYHCFTIKTPEGMIDDGKVSLSDEFVEKLKSRCKEYNIKTKKVIFSVSSTKIATKEVLIPYVKEKRIQDIVFANASEYFPVDISEYRLAYKIVDIVQGENKDEKQYKLLVLAAPGDLIDSYINLAINCGLSVVNIDYYGNSIFQLFKDQYKEGSHLIIKLDENSVLLTFIKNNSSELQRTVLYGMDSLIRSVMDSDLREHISYDEAVELLRTKQLIQGYFEDDYANFSSNNNEGTILDEFAHLQKIVTETTNSLRYLVTGISRVINYYTSRNNGAVPEHFILTGYGSDFLGLDSLLSSELRHEVQLLKDMKGITIEKSLQQQNINLGDYIVTLGAAIAPISLLTETLNTEKKKRAEEKKKASFNISIILFIGGILISAAFAFVSISTYKEELRVNRNLKARVEGYDVARLIYEDYQNAKTFYDDIQNMSNLLESPNEGLNDFINELEEKMPSNMSVQSFSATSESVSMDIYVTSKEESAAVIHTLRTFDSLSDVEVAGINETRDEAGNTTVNFVVNCIYDTNPTIDTTDETTQTEE